MSLLDQVQSYLHRVYDNVPRQLLNQVARIIIENIKTKENHFIKGASFPLLQVTPTALEHVVADEHWAERDPIPFNWFFKEPDINQTEEHFTCYHQSMLRVAFDMNVDDKVVSLGPLWASARDDNLYHNQSLSTMYNLTVPAGSKVWASYRRGQDSKLHMDWIVWGGEWTVTRIEEAPFTAYNVKKLLQGPHHRAIVTACKGVMTTTARTVSVAFKTKSELHRYVTKWGSTTPSAVWEDWNSGSNWLPHDYVRREGAQNPQKHVLHALSELRDCTIVYHCYFARTVDLQLKRQWPNIIMTFDNTQDEVDSYTRRVITTEGIARRLRL